MHGRLIHDLLKHASDQMHGAARRAGDLIDDDGVRNLFYITLVGQVLTRIARELHPHLEGEDPPPEALIVACMVMLRAVTNGKLPKMNEAALARRADAIYETLRLEAEE